MPVKHVKVSVLVSQLHTHNMPDAKPLWIYPPPLRGVRVPHTHVLHVNASALSHPYATPNTTTNSTTNIPDTPMLVCESFWCNESIQAGVESGVLQAMPCNQCEQAVECQHALKAALVQCVGQEVAEQQWAAHGRQDVRV